MAEQNGVADVVEVLHCKMEDAELPEMVDIIVSEWMGYLLIYESMLRSVIVARDRFLKPDGLMFPSHAKLYMTAYSDTKYFGSYVDYWDDVMEHQPELRNRTPRKIDGYEEPVSPLYTEFVLAGGVEWANECIKKARELQKLKCRYLTSMHARAATAVTAALVAGECAAPV